jgi:Ca2+-binding EF-hand superfamily protein
MTRILPGALLLASLALLALTPAGPAAAPVKDDAPHRIVYLGDRGPLLIELHLRIDGKPLRSAYRTAFDKLFDSLDRDRDGVLSREEAARAPSTALLANPLLAARRGGPLPGRALRLGSDGKMTRADLMAHYGKNGLPALQMTSAAIQPDRLVRFGGGGNEPTGEELTNRLFRLLDTDKDGMLSHEELRAAPAVLGALDVDEDEMITPAEVMGEAGADDPYGKAFVVATRQPARSGPPPLHVVADASEDEALAKTILQRYGKGGAALSAAALGLSKEAMAALDRDGDGKLSAEELARFADRPADVALTVLLAPAPANPAQIRRAPQARVRGREVPAARPAKPNVLLRAGRPLPEGIEVNQAAGGVTIQIGSTRLDLTVPAPAGLIAVPVNLREQYRNIFRRLDSDNKGCLTRDQMMRIPFFRDSFEAMDRDGDGKVTEKEMLAYVDEVDGFRLSVERACASLAVSNEGRGLFGLLDTNGDGRLSVRELRDAHKLLAKLDRDGDGKLARGEVPRHDRVTVALGPNGGQDPLGRRVSFVNRMDARRDPRAAAERGPLWFRKMDRNRDGDVSRKEFLGTDEQFRAIDADGDGLISVEEAEAYDRRKPQEAERPRGERGERRGGERRRE